MVVLKKMDVLYEHARKLKCGVQLIVQANLRKVVFSRSIVPTVFFVFEELTPILFKSQKTGFFPPFLDVDSITTNVQESWDMIVAGEQSSIGIGDV